MNKERVIQKFKKKQKQQSPIVEKGFSTIGIAEKWKEIINRWKDIPPIDDDSIAPWPLVEGLMKKINQNNPKLQKKYKRSGCNHPEL